MGGGGGGKQPAQPTHTTQTIKQNLLPEYLRPYVTDVAGQAQAISREGYTPFPGQRIAGFDPSQTAAFGQVEGMRTPADFGRARQFYERTAGGGLQATSAGLGRATQYLAAPTQQFGEAQAAQYMSPYQQAVTDVALRKAQEEATRQQGRDYLTSAGRGSAGGSRQAVMQAMRDRALGDRSSDIQIRGSERGYLSAQQQFERDRMARQRQGQLGAQFGMQGLTAQMQAGRGLAALGPAEQRAELERISAMERVGGVRQAMGQRAMDMQYQDFLRQRDYPKEQMGWYSNILRGLPSEMGSSELTYQRDPSLSQQITGLGLAGLGAYGAYKNITG